MDPAPDLLPADGFPQSERALRANATGARNRPAASRGIAVACHRSPIRDERAGGRRHGPPTTGWTRVDGAARPKGKGKKGEGRRQGGRRRVKAKGKGPLQTGDMLYTGQQLAAALDGSGGCMLTLEC